MHVKRCIYVSILLLYDGGTGKRLIPQNNTYVWNIKAQESDEHGQCEKYGLFTLDKLGHRKAERLASSSESSADKKCRADHENELQEPNGAQGPSK